MTAAAWAISAIASGASTVADWPVSRLENRSTSASNRCRISLTVDFIADTMFHICSACSSEPRPRHARLFRIAVTNVATPLPSTNARYSALSIGTRAIRPSESKCNPQPYFFGSIDARKQA